MSMKNLMNDEKLKTVLCNEKIRLEIYDETKYQEIALLVDSPKFLLAVKTLRAKFNIQAPIVAIPKNLITFSGWNKVYREWAVINVEKDKQLNADLQLLVNQLGKPLYMLPYVIQGVFYKLVIDRLGIVRVLSKKVHFENAQVAIIPTIHTDEKEILEAWRQVKVFFKILPEEFHQTEQRYNRKPEFQRNREWYWRIIGGESYSEIAEEWNKEHYDKDETEQIKMVTADSIAHSVEDYYQLLQS